MYQRRLFPFYYVDIVKKIKENNGKSFRPSLPTNSDKPKIVDLMKACWDEIAFKRPTFRSIKKQLKEITRFVSL